MNIIVWIIFGALAGWIVSMLTGEDARMGPVANIFVGILGAVIGGWIVNLLGSGVDGFNVGSFLVAILGAVVLIMLLRAVSDTSHRI